MRLWLIGFAASTIACGYPSLPELPDAGNSGMNDGPLDGSASRTFGSFVRVTFAMMDVPMTPLMITDTTSINTDSSALCDDKNDQATTYCVVAGSEIKLSANVTATGSKPLIFLSTSSFELSGNLEVSSKRGGLTGPGAASPIACVQTVAATGTGGGYGGSFGGAGGAGESIEADNGGTAAPALTAFPDTLQGGCPGGNNATDTGGVAGVGGAGGGAVDIIATSITVSGAINASGAAGGGGSTAGDKSSGGGGGGAGGMIVFDAPTVAAGTQPVVIYANGAGGGQGGTGSDPGKGPGADGREPTDADMIASGGSSGSRAGGAGGDGTAGFRTNGNPGHDALSTGGGGGGGGGIGFIRSPAITGTADVSPAPTAPPAS